MVKFKCRYPLWLLLIATAVPIAAAYRAIGQVGTDGFGWPIFGVAPMTLVAALFAFAIRNRQRRPVVEIGDNFISHGSVFQAARRRERLSDIAEILPGNQRNIVLRMRSGRERKISTFEVAHPDRDVVRQAIADAVSHGLE